MIRIAIAEHDLLSREGIRRLLENESDLELVAVAPDGRSLLGLVERAAPDVVMTNVKMPPGYGIEGIDLAQALRGSHRDIGVIVLSQYAELRYALALLDTGTAGRGYLLKNRLEHKEQLGEAIRQVAAGGSVIDPMVVELLLTCGGRDTTSALRGVTQREQAVLGELAAGKSNAAIGRSLGISKRAVEAHVRAIFAKLDLRGEATSARVAATLVVLANERPGLPETSDSGLHFSDAPR